MISDIVNIKAVEDLCGCLQLPIRRGVIISPGATRAFILWDHKRPDCYRMVAETKGILRDINYTFTDDDKMFIRKVANDYAIY